MNLFSSSTLFISITNLFSTSKWQMSILFIKRFHSFSRSNPFHYKICCSKIYCMLKSHIQTFNTRTFKLLHTLCSVHFLSDFEEATTLSMNAMPRMPSSTEGKSSISFVGSLPLSFEDSVSEKFL
jgi:hypothetical protein